MTLTEDQMREFREEFASDTPAGRMWRRIREFGDQQEGQTLAILRAVVGHVWGEPTLRQAADAALFLGISEAEVAHVLNTTPMGQADDR